MESETARKLEADASLSHRIKLGYGAADFGLAAVESMVQIYLFKFYNVVVGLPALYTAWRWRWPLSGTRSATP